MLTVCHVYICVYACMRTCSTAFESTTCCTLCVTYVCSMNIHTYMYTLYREMLRVHLCVCVCFWGGPCVCVIFIRGGEDAYSLYVTYT